MPHLFRFRCDCSLMLVLLLCLAAGLWMAGAGGALAEQSLENRRIDDLCCHYGRFFPKGTAPQSVSTRIFKAQAQRLLVVLYSQPREGMDQAASTQECKRQFEWCNTEGPRDRTASRFRQKYRSGLLGPGSYVRDVMRHAMRYSPDTLADAEKNYVCTLDSLNPPGRRISQCRNR
mgnify:CR=1 FL=1